MVANGDITLELNSDGTTVGTGDDCPSDVDLWTNVMGYPNQKTM